MGVGGEFGCPTIALGTILPVGLPCPSLTPRALLYVQDASPTPRVVALLEKARTLGVNLHPIHVLSRDGPDSTWSASFTKLMHAGLVEYDRVLHLDSDGLIMQNMGAPS